MVINDEYTFLNIAMHTNFGGSIANIQTNWCDNTYVYRFFGKMLHLHQNSLKYRKIGHSVSEKSDRLVSGYSSR